MRKTGRIVSVGESRTGTNKNGDWMMTPVVFEWMEHSINSDPYKQSIVGDVSGAHNWDAVNKAIKDAEEIEVNFFLSTNEYNGRTFNNVRMVLPKNFKEA